MCLYSHGQFLVSMVGVDRWEGCRYLWYGVWMGTDMNLEISSTPAPALTHTHTHAHINSTQPTHKKGRKGRWDGSRAQGAGKQGMGRLEGRCKQGASKVEGDGRAQCGSPSVQCACTLLPGTRPVRLLRLLEMDATD